MNNVHGDSPIPTTTTTSILPGKKVKPVKTSFPTVTPLPEPSSAKIPKAAPHDKKKLEGSIERKKTAFFSKSEVNEESAKLAKSLRKDLRKWSELTKTGKVTQTKSTPSTSFEREAQMFQYFRGVKSFQKALDYIKGSNNAILSMPLSPEGKIILQENAKVLEHMIFHLEQKISQEPEKEVMIHRTRQLEVLDEIIAMNERLSSDPVDFINKKVELLEKKVELMDKIVEAKNKVFEIDTTYANNITLIQGEINELKLHREEMIDKTQVDKNQVGKTVQVDETVIEPPKTQRTPVANLGKILNEIEELPMATNYNKIPKSVVEKKRKNMNSFLDSLGRKLGIGIPFRGKEEVSNWLIDITKLEDNKVYNIAGKFEITGREIKEIVNSTRVTFDMTRVSREDIAKILTYGADLSNKQEYLKARGRCVRSKIPLVVDQKCNTIKRSAKNESIQSFDMYTMNAPDLRKGGHDYNIYVKKNGELDHEAYKNEMKALLSHYLLECKHDGVQIPVIPGFGMGVFAGDHQEACYRAFAEALKEVIKDQGQDFEQVVFADPNEKLVDVIKEKAGKETKLHICNKSGLDVVQVGTKNGGKMGFLNPGDPRGYPGENWERGHFALEEMIGMFTLLVLAQNANICPQISDGDSYIPRFLPISSDLKSVKAVKAAATAASTAAPAAPAQTVTEGPKQTKAEKIREQVDDLRSMVAGKKERVGGKFIEFLLSNTKPIAIKKEIEASRDEISAKLLAIEKEIKSTSTIFDPETARALESAKKELDQIKNEIGIDLNGFVQDVVTLRAALKNNQVEKFLQNNPGVVARSLNWLPKDIIRVDAGAKFKEAQQDLYHSQDLTKLNRTLAKISPGLVSSASTEKPSEPVGIKVARLTVASNMRFLSLKAQVEEQKRKLGEYILKPTDELHQKIQEGGKLLSDEINEEIRIIDTKLATVPPLSEEEKKIFMKAKANLNKINLGLPILSSPFDSIDQLKSNPTSSKDIENCINFLPNEVIGTQDRDKYLELKRAKEALGKGESGEIDVQIATLEEKISFNLKYLLINQRIEDTLPTLNGGELIKIMQELSETKVNLGMDDPIIKRIKSNIERFILTTSFSQPILLEEYKKLVSSYTVNSLNEKIHNLSLDKENRELIASCSNLARDTITELSRSAENLTIDQKVRENTIAAAHSIYIEVLLIENKIKEENNPDRKRRLEAAKSELMLIRDSININIDKFEVVLQELSNIQPEDVNAYLKKNPDVIKNYIHILPDALVKKMGPNFENLKKVRNEIYNLPPCKFYDEFNEMMDGKLTVVEARRKDMNEFLDSLGRKQHEGFTFTVNDEGRQWSIDIDSLRDDAIYTLGGGYELKGSEIKKIVNSTKVSFRKGVIDATTLHTFLTQGANPSNPTQSAQARGRCVASDIPMAVNQKGKTILRKIGEKLPIFRMYTMNAPNVAMGEFLNDKGELDREGYKAEMKALLSHYLSECKADGIEVPVIPGFGMGVFLPPNHKQECYKVFGEILNEIVGNYGFKEVIFADPNAALLEAVKTEAGGCPVLTISNKSGLEVVEAGARRGVKMAFLNPGDPSCYPGQNWEKGHFALEEMLGIFSLLVLAQHPNICKQVANQQGYKVVTIPSMANSKVLNQNQDYVAAIGDAQQMFTEAKDKLDKARSDLLKYLKENLPDTQLSPENQKIKKQLIKDLESALTIQDLRHLISVPITLSKADVSGNLKTKIQEMSKAIDLAVKQRGTLESASKKWVTDNFEVFSDSLIRSIPNVHVKPISTDKPPLNIDLNNNGLAVKKKDLKFSGKKVSIKRNGKTMELEEVVSGTINGKQYSSIKGYYDRSNGRLYHSADDARYHDHVIGSKPNEPPMITLCDGTGHSEGAIITAAKTAETAHKELSKGIKNCNDLREVLKLQLDALKKANEETKGTNGSTTFIQTAVVGNYLTGIVIGDSKAYIFRKNKEGGWTAIDPLGNIKGTLEVQDSGGQISGDEEVLSDLQRTHAFAYPLEPGDVVYVCSDGVVDNFDPLMNKIPPNKLSKEIGEKEWEKENPVHIEASLNESRKKMEEVVKDCKTGKEIAQAIAGFVEENTKANKTTLLTQTNFKDSDLLGKRDDAAASYFVYQP